MQAARTFLGLAALALASAFIAAVVTVYVLDDDAPVQNTDLIRCEEALDYRQSIIEAGPYSRPLRDDRPANPDGVEDYDERLEDAENEIRRYC